MRILATLHAGLTRLGGVIQWLDGTIGLAHAPCVRVQGDCGARCDSI